MHKARHKLVPSHSGANVQPSRKPGSAARVGLLGLVVFLVVMVAAWIDGGEEPIHRIETPVRVPSIGAAG
ncbi:MAG: hypothetical protein AAFY51_04935 [Pseudomonadota bacterium]